VRIRLLRNDITADITARSARIAIATIALAAVLAALFAAPPRRKIAAAESAAGESESVKGKTGGYFLPSGAAAKIVTVTRTGAAEAGITVLTEATAVKENGPRVTVKKFGEVYAFSPTFIAVHREQPTQIEFWNLQPDDEHDFALLGEDLTVLMYQRLLPLTKTSFIFTFHREGVIEFKCLRHQPEMSGQILVLPPAGK
jgi:plastocyanin